MPPSLFRLAKSPVQLGLSRYHQYSWNHIPRDLLSKETMNESGIAKSFHYTGRESVLDHIFHQFLGLFHPPHKTLELSGFTGFSINETFLEKIFCYMPYVITNAEVKFAPIVVLEKTFELFWPSKGPINK